jgi:FeS assembly SUF system protein
MSIFNLDDVSPSQTKTDSENESPAGPNANTPVAPIPRTEPSIDTSALTAPSPATEPVPELTCDPVKTLELKPKIVDQLVTVFDPEIPVNIYELGLIYDIIVDPEGLAVIKMTLTAPNCPAAITLPAEVQGKVKSVEGVTDARVDLVWEPPWDKDRMTDAAKLQLGIFD